MNPETRWIGISSALLLLLGIFIGIGMDRLLFRPAPEAGPGAPPFMGDVRGGGRHGPPGHRLLARLSEALELTDQQQAEVGEIFRRHLPKLRRARREGGDFQAARREMREALSKVLSEAQMEKFKHMRRPPRDRIPPPPGGDIPAHQE
ncbi:MAG: hypothetical protein ACE5FC_06955 [Myxococcota bacterium]